MLRMLVLGGDRAFGMVKHKNMVIDQVNLLTNLKIEKHRGRNFLILNKNYSSFEYDAFFINGYFESDALRMLYVLESEKTWFNQPFYVFSALDSYKQLLYSVKNKFSTSVDFSLKKDSRPTLSYEDIAGKTSQVVVFAGKAFILSNHGHVLQPRLSQKCKSFVRAMRLDFGTVSLIWPNSSKEIFFQEFSPYIPFSELQNFHVSTILNAVEDKIFRVRTL
jgi:hypothetical protein